MILDEIAEYTKERVRALKAHKSLYAVRDEAEGRPQGKDFRAALAAPGLSVIAEAEEGIPPRRALLPPILRTSTCARLRSTRPAAQQPSPA